MTNLTEAIYLKYYTVFVTRYKRPVFQDDEIVQLLLNSFNDLEQSNDVQIESVKIEACYVYLSFTAGASKSPNQLAALLKSAGYQAILKNIPHLKSLWVRDMMYRTTPITHEEITEFLMTIKRRG